MENRYHYWGEIVRYSQIMPKNFMKITKCGGKKIRYTL